MKRYIKIDENGYAVFNGLHLPFNQRTLNISDFSDEGEIPENYILAYEGGGFCHPCWDGEKWVEGLTQEEIDELRKPQPSELTEADILRAQNKALTDRLEFVEDVIAEMAMMIYD